MDCKALKKLTQRRSVSIYSLCVFLFIVLSIVGVSFAKSAKNASTTSIPKPFFFTENKGQWDEKVLFKCDAGNGLIWFLERDGFTLLATTVDKTQPPIIDPIDRDLPEALRMRPSRYPLKGHALKFKFVNENIPPLVPPNGVRGDNLSPSQAGGRGGVYLPALAKYFEGKSNIAQPFSNNVQDVPPLLPPNGVRGDNLSPSQAEGRGGVYLPALAKYFEGKSNISPPFSNNVQDVPPLVPPAQQGGYENGEKLPNTLTTQAKYVEGFGELPWKNNYFLGNDSTKWAPNCRNFTSVYYKDVWEGIDIEWYESNGKLEFDFIVQPGANPEQIRIAVEGLEGELSLPHTKNDPPLLPPNGVRGDALRSAQTTGGTQPHNSPATRGRPRGKQLIGDELILPTSLGELRTVLPKVYQIDGSGHIIDIPAKFQLIGYNDKRIHPPIVPPFTGGKANVPIADENHTGSNTNKYFENSKSNIVNTFGVTLPEGYNPDHPLRIDPLIYSTFLGGSGNDFVFGVSDDESGGIFVTGVTSSNNFPTTPGVYDPTYSGTDDCFITHLNSTGSQILYSTYLGNLQNVSGRAIVNDGSGGVIVTGSNGGWEGLNYDCFVARLNSTGSQLIYYVFIGGSGDDYGYDLVNDGSGGVFVTGETNSFDFPTTAGAYDTSYNGGYDCFVFHLNSAGLQLIFSTFLGGSGSDFGLSVVNDNSSGVIVTGTTWSPNFPVTVGAYDTSYAGGNDYGGDVFITHLNTVGSQLFCSTYLGGSGADIGLGIISDGGGGVIVSGFTNSIDFPTTIGAYDTSYNGSIDCFIAHLNNTGTQLIYSTFIGGSGSDAGSAIDNDGSGNIILTGRTSSTNFPVTIGAYDDSYNGGYDSFVTQLNISDSQLLYSTYLGGLLDDEGIAIASNSSGGVILVGMTNSADFPISTVAYDTSYNGGFPFGDCFITRLSMEPDTNDVSQEINFAIQNYALNQNYPNPFNSSTVISYSLPRSEIIEIKFYDLMGREVSTIVNQWQTHGNHRVVLDGKNLSSGVYFIQMKAGKFLKTRKMVLMK